MPTIYSGGPDVLADLRTVFKSAVPADVGSTTEVRPTTESLMLAEGVTAHYTRESRWGTADGKYLELHARGLGLFKQDGETDDQLRERMRTPPLAVTPDLIKQALQQIVDANGGGAVFIVELPRDASYLRRDYCLSRGNLIGDARRHMIIARIPASAGCKAACEDALRTKRLASKAYMVEEYT